MADEELSQDEVDDSLKEQGFAPEYGPTDGCRIWSHSSRPTMTSLWRPK